MTLRDFAVRLLVGFFLGVGIGIERQWLRERAILKTNVLVTLGAAIFVMLSIMTPGDASPTRISAQIVSGVGFLGGGVILREGASVRGTNTAATLWCAAAIGTLVGSGYLVQAYLSTFTVVSANLLLRPLVKAFRQPEEKISDRDDDAPYWDEGAEADIVSVRERRSLASKEISDSQNVTYSKLSSIESLTNQTHYICRLTCYSDRETEVLSRLFQFAKKPAWQLVKLDSTNILPQKQTNSKAMVEITADFISQNGSSEPENIEKIVSSLKSDYTVNSVSWQFAID